MTAATVYADEPHGLHELGVQPFELGETGYRPLGRRVYPEVSLPGYETQLYAHDPLWGRVHVHSSMLSAAFVLGLGQGQRETGAWLFDQCFEPMRAFGGAWTR